MNAQWIQTTSGHTKIKNLLVTYIPLSQQIIDRIQPECVSDKNFTVYIPDRQDWKNNGIILNNDVVCFTDGSRFEQTGLSGAGVYNQTDGEEFILPLGRHVFQALRSDILRKAGLLESLVNRNNSSVAICCDSLVAIMLFQPLRQLPAWWLMLWKH